MNLAQAPGRGYIFATYTPKKVGISILTPCLTLIFLILEGGMIRFCFHFVVLTRSSEESLVNGLKTRLSHPERDLSVRRKSTVQHRSDCFCVRACLSWEARFQVGNGVTSCPSQTESSRCAAAPAADLSKHGNLSCSPFASRLSPFAPMVVGVPPFHRHVAAGAFLLSRRILARTDRIVRLFPIPDSYSPGVRQQVDRSHGFNVITVM